jgi:DNA (cytosine-5)-methyltransferase 1
MDTTKTTTHIGLCAGYGGIELGLKRVIPNLRSVALCEIEAFAIANLVSKMEAGLMDPAPIWPDLRTFPWGAFRDRVDILTGGYPCQPFSSAGKRAGKDDPRHLWPYIADGIRLLRPKLCFFENVEGHISLGLSDVIEDLAGMGYRTTWGIFSAAECGAPHQRKRVFILAISSSLGGAAWLSGSFPRHEGQSGESDDGGGEVMADAERNGRRASTGNAGTMGAAQCSQEGGESQPRTTASSAYGGCDSPAWPSRPGEQQYGWEPPRVVGDAASPRPQERPRQRGSGIQGTDADGGADAGGQTQPPLGGDADGPAGGMDYAELCVSGDNRTDELRLLGNGVVPATAERAFRVLIKELYTAPAGS